MTRAAQCAARQFARRVAPVGLTDASPSRFAHRDACAACVALPRQAPSRSSSAYERHIQDMRCNAGQSPGWIDRARCRVVARYGYRPQSAGNGQRAFQCCSSCPRPETPGDFPAASRRFAAAASRRAPSRSSASAIERSAAAAAGMSPRVMARRSTQTFVNARLRLVSAAKRSSAGVSSMRRLGFLSARRPCAARAAPRRPASR